MTKTPILIVLLTSCLSLKSQEKKDSINFIQRLNNLTSITEEKPWALYPQVGLSSSPEAGIGFLCNMKYMFKTDSLSNVSVLDVGGGYSLSGQIFARFNYDLSLSGDKWRLRTEHSWNRSPTNFFGIGNNTKKEEKETVDIEFTRHNIRLSKKVGEYLFIGPTARTEIAYKLEFEQNSIANKLEFLGKESTRTVELGFNIIADKRNARFYPTKGKYFLVETVMSEEYLGSEYSYTKVLMDLRWFKAIYKNQVLAIQTQNILAIGNVPYRSYATMGKDYFMRGVHENRYIDKQLLSTQIEYRIPVLSILHLNLFGAAGQVQNRLTAFRLDQIHLSYGAGARVVLDTKRKISVRLDYALSKDMSGFYIDINEAF